MQEPLTFIVPFDEADGEGIVFFGNYFRLAHRALEQYLPRIGIAWKNWFAHPEWGVPLRHVDADYLRPLRPGDTYQVLITVENCGESSVHFKYEFRVGSESVAHLKTSHVFVSRAQMKKISVPPEFAEILRLAKAKTSV